MALLEVKNLHTYFKTRKGIVKAVNDVSYSLESGKTIGIVGESGSGKSVSAMSILQLLDGNGYIAEGEVLFEGKDLTKLSQQEMYSIRGNKISVIFQEPMTSLNPVFTVKRQLSEPFIIHQKLNKKESEKKALCTLIYYPQEKLQIVKEQEKDMNDWYLTTLNKLVSVCQNVSSKYTRSKVRKSLPEEFSYIIQELLHETVDDQNKQGYITQIINTIISTQRADDFIIAMCNLIQRLTIDSLHIVGDIFDRGPGAHIIMDTLCNYHNVDIQWGNHDLLWMGAAAGNDSCIANVIRISMRYGTLTTLEEGYGINLLPLATFAMDTYANDPCTVFALKQKYADKTYPEKTLRLIAQMHKAIAVIQFKLEAGIIKRHPEFGMDGRLLLDKIDFKRGMLCYGGKEYKMLDSLPSDGGGVRFGGEAPQFVHPQREAAQAYPLFHDRGKHVSCVQQQSAFPCLDSVECRRLVQGGDNPR